MDAIWEQNRRRALEKLNEHLRLGLVDEDIIYLLELINSYDFMFTTSSCSGRIGLMYIPPSRKKHECERLGKRHQPVEPKVVIDTLKKWLENRSWEGFVILKQEPPILDIAVKDLDIAQKVLSIARAIGFKNSGIKSHNPKRSLELLELWSTERLDVPVARPDYVVPDDYLYRVVKLANENLVRSKKKLRELYERLQSSFNS